MKKVEDKLNEILDISETLETVKPTPVIPRPKEKEDIDSDYKYSRENLYNLVERGQDAIDGIVNLAKETDHPRAYEVAGTLIKNVGDVTEKLLALQEKMKKLERKWYLLNISYELCGSTSLDTSPFSKSNVIFSTCFLDRNQVHKKMFS